MALIDCVECGRKVSSEALACPSCGHPVPQPESSECDEIEQPRIGGWLALLAIVLVAVTPGVAVLGWAGAGSLNDANLVGLPLAAWAAWCGSLIVQRKVEAVRRTKHYLWSQPVVYLLLTLVYVGDTYLWDEVQRGEEVFARAFLYSLVFAAAWSLYLDKSTRVRRTLGQGREGRAAS